MFDYVWIGLTSESIQFQHSHPAVYKDMQSERQ